MNNKSQNKKAQASYARKQQEFNRGKVAHRNKANLLSESKISLHQAKKIIHEAKINKSKKLDLSYSSNRFKLETIPSEVFELIDLEEINLFNNNIKVIPEEIISLKNLKRINVALNPIRRMPNLRGITLDWSSYLILENKLSDANIEGVWISVFSGSLGIYTEKPVKRFPIFLLDNTDYVLNKLLKLKNLNNISIISRYFENKFDLNISQDRIDRLIDNINLFENLSELWIHGINFGEIPKNIKQLKKLRSLTISHAGISEVPGWIEHLSELRVLSLYSNLITDLPASLENLKNIEYISLDNNPIKEVPKVFFKLPNINHIHINYFDYNNKGEYGLIKCIPDDILKLKELKSFEISGQPIELPPFEVVREGVESIKNYWRQNLEGDIDYLCEAKMIIIGEAGAGKTSLVKKIENLDYILQPQEASTEGIDVVRWNFPTSIRVKRNNQEEFHQTDFKVIIWDFGGQEIYHSTHQFFLTRRSLYVLVVDDRKEDTDFNYWLQIVDLLSDGSPLLIVQNEKQDRQRSIDIESLRANFPNLKLSLRTNLATNRGLEIFKNEIKYELERLPHIGSSLLKTWTQVRVALENDNRNYISLDDYFIICQNNGFERRNDKLQLGRYLHDLGICLHFQDDPVLKNVVILKPKWGTDAVYKILDDQTILNNKGSFSVDDLLKIWSDEEHCNMKDELLRLMMKFQLCYKLEHSDNYIAPQMLSPNRPDYTWESASQLIIRYEYDFMPKGIITRFIVALNHLIKDQKLVWKSGVVIKRDNTYAEIIEEYSRRKITVRVSGSDSRGLLAIVDDHLEKINNSYSKLRYKKMLPCNCDICNISDDSYAYSLKELLDFAMHNDYIQCRVSRKLINAANLIEDILPSAIIIAEESIIKHGILSKNISIAKEKVHKKEVYVSYAWNEESVDIINKLQETLTKNNIKLLRDVNELDYKSSIKNFMKNIGGGNAVILILSKKYFESTNCMFELSEIMKNGNFRDRIFPIILEGTNIFTASDRVKYAKYWEAKKLDLDKEIKELSGEYLHGIREELDLFATYRAVISEITNNLSDMNALTPSQHRGSNFDSLLQKLLIRIDRPN